MATAAAIRESEGDHHREDRRLHEDGGLNRTGWRARLAAVAFLAVAAATLPIGTGGAAAAESCPSGQAGVCVTVEGTGRETTQSFVPLTTIADSTDVTDTQYSTRAVAGGPVTSEPRVFQGLSIRGLLHLQQVGVDPAAVTYTTVVGRTTYQSHLSAQTHDFDDPASSDFPFENSLQPVFWPGNANSIDYIRPLREDNADVNLLDYLQSDSGGQLQLTVHTSGTVLHPNITAPARPLSVRVGQTVSFAATTVDADTTETLGYTWTFGDGSTAQGAQATHVYSAPGSYLAYTEVAGSNGSSGESIGVTITVTPGPSRTPTPTPTPSHTRPTTGPSHGTGGSHNPTSGPISGHGHHGGGAPQTGAPNNSIPGSGTGPGAAPAGSPEIPAAGPGGVVVPAVVGGAADTVTSSAQPSGAVPVPRPAGNRVVGYLLAGFAVTSGHSPSHADHRPLTAPAARNGRLSHSIPVWLLVVFGILVLLVLGARAEARRPRQTVTRQHR